MHRTKSVNFCNKIKVLITYKQYILFLSFSTEENSSFVKSLKFITILLLLNINTRGPVIERFCNRHITKKVNLCNRDVQSVQKNHCNFPYNHKDWIKLIPLQYTCCLAKLLRGFPTLFPWNVIQFFILSWFVIAQDNFTWTWKRS